MPFGSWSERKSARWSVPFRIFADVTASLLSCAVPTLFLGSAAVTAAKPVPPSAMPSARHAMINAGETRPVVREERRNMGNLRTDVC